MGKLVALCASMTFVLFVVGTVALADVIDGTAGADLQITGDTVTVLEYGPSAPPVG